MDIENRHYKLTSLIDGHRSRIGGKYREKERERERERKKKEKKERKSKGEWE